MTFQACGEAWSPLSCPGSTDAAYACPHSPRWSRSYALSGSSASSVFGDLGPHGSQPGGFPCPPLPLPPPVCQLPSVVASEEPADEPLVVAPSVPDGVPAPLPREPPLP